MGDTVGNLYATGGVSVSSGTPSLQPCNRTETSSDGGQHWTTIFSGVVTPQTQYSYRAYHQCTVDPLTNYAYVMNGYSTTATNRGSTSLYDPRLPINDVYMTMNVGLTWSLVSSTPPYAPRYSSGLHAYYSAGLRQTVFVLIAGCTVNQAGTNYTEAALNDV
jgi:hypothetical protein